MRRQSQTERRNRSGKSTNKVRVRRREGMVRDNRRTITQNIM
jgi:hypothetical protein